MATDPLSLQLDGVPSHQDKAKRQSVFAYATLFDRVTIAISCLCAISAGALNPLLTVIYGNLVGSFQDYANGSTTSSTLRQNISRFTLFFVYLAVGEFVLVYVATVGFFHTGQRISQSLRKAYFRAVLRQNMAFFDRLGTGEVTTRLTSDMHLVQEGISGRISLTLTALATFCTAFVVSFVMFWKLGLTLVPAVAAMAAANVFGGKRALHHTRQATAAYSAAAAVSEEAIRSIKHVAALNAQETMARKYLAHVRRAEGFGVRARVVSALGVASFMGVMYLSYGLAFWQGSRYLVRGDVTGAGVVTATMAVVIGAVAVGKIAPNAEAFVASVASAEGIFDTVGRRSPQDPLSEEGDRLENVEGHIAFRGVRLAYPARPDVTVLDGVDLDFPARRKTALVGASGCGKSSIVELIERFYMPLGGQISMFPHATLHGLDLDIIFSQPWTAGRLSR